MTEYFAEVKCVTSKKRTDFGSDPDDGADPGMFKRNVCHCGMSAIEHVLLKTQEFVGDYLRNVSGIGCLTGNKTFDFTADSGHEPDPVISAEFHRCGIEPTVRILRDHLPWQRFAVSNCF